MPVTVLEGKGGALVSALTTYLLEVGAENVWTLMHMCTIASVKE